jgi:hypothetical protein
MKPHERNNTNAKPKNKIKQGMINLVVEHSYFDKKTQPINWMGAPKIYTCHTAYTFYEVSNPSCQIHNSPFSLKIVLRVMLLHFLTITGIVFLYGGHTMYNQLLWVCCSHHWNSFLSLMLPI